MLVGVVALAGALTACSSGADVTERQIISDAGRAEVRRALDDVVAAGYAGVQVVVTEHGRNWTASAGTANIETGAGFPEDARVRIGSNTKPFVATAILQLVSEGKVDLDAPVDRYLPGVIQGDGIDGTRIAVRNILQHTSGLPEYLELPELNFDDVDTALRQRFDAAAMVRNAVSTMPGHFPPGEKAEYSNTNYLVAGLLIEKVTGNPYGDELTRRISEPLGLHATYVPAWDETDLRTPHPQGYEVIDGVRTDITRFPTSLAGPAGAMVSTGAELNRFFTALLSGKLLPPAQLAQMQRDTRPLSNRPAGIDYGLGLAELAVPCAKEVWGHGGSIPGFKTFNGVTADGRAVSVVANERTADDTTVQHVFDTAVCAAS